MRHVAILSAVLVLTTAAPAVALTGAGASPGAKVPYGVETLRIAGPVCATGTANFKIWWSEVGATPLAGSDGNCLTVPPAAEETAAASERGRSVLQGMGFPATVGDALPVVRIAGSYRTLVRLRPAARATAFRRLSALRRGRLLLGYSKAQRTNLLRGLPAALQRTLRRNLAAAQVGRPSDFIGGDRRVDVVLQVTAGALGTNDGVTRCRWDGAQRGAARFTGTSMIILTSGPSANVTTVAHELFHVVQCNMGADDDPSELLMEGSAEWSSGVIEPGKFAGTGTTGPSGISVDGGAASAASFCNGFAPRAGGTESYRSWPVWAALEAQAPGTVLGILRRVVSGTGVPTPDSVVAMIGRERWSSALMRAASDVCGGLRSPAGTVQFPVETRSFIGWDEAGALTARPGGAPVTVAAQAAGLVSIRANVGTPPAGSAFVSVPGLTADMAVQRLVVTNTAGAPLPLTPEAAGVRIAAPGTADGIVIITFANPSTTEATGLAVSVQ